MSDFIDATLNRLAAGVSRDCANAARKMRALARAGGWSADEVLVKLADMFDATADKTERGEQSALPAKEGEAG